MDLNYLPKEKNVKNKTKRHEAVDKRMTIILTVQHHKDDSSLKTRFKKQIYLLILQIHIINTNPITPESVVVKDGWMNNFDSDTAIKMISDISQKGRNYTSDQIIISVRKKKQKSVSYTIC